MGSFVARRAVDLHTDWIRISKAGQNHSQRICEAYEGQFPKAVILSCLESRIPVEDVFDLGIGDVKVGRSLQTVRAVDNPRRRRRCSIIASTPATSERPLPPVAGSISGTAATAML